MIIILYVWFFYKKVRGKNCCCKVHYFLRIFTTNCRIKVYHNFACEIIDDPMFTSVFDLLGFFTLRGNSKQCFVCVLLTQFVFLLYVLSVRASKKLNNFNTGGLSNNFERWCMPVETAGSSVNKWSLLIINAIFTKSEKQ